jgi:predicted ATPase/class 3 adenylate cyclase
MLAKAYAVWVWWWTTHRGHDVVVAGLPTGTVTMVFSDVEGSTKLLARLGAAYADALAGQRRVLRRAWAEHSGTEMGTEGDSFFVVFPTAPDAVNAVVQAQRGLAVFDWPAGERVRLRMGIHTGSPTVHDGGYVGLDVHRAARIAAAAHGGQVVMSEATAYLVRGVLPPGTSLVGLGSHQLRDIAQPEHVYQLSIDGLQTDFPPLKTLGAASRLPRSATPLVGRDGELAELTALLGSPEVRLVTLTGPGGSGKSRLAVGLAHRLTETFVDGVYFVPLAAVTNADVMWTTIAEVLDVPPTERIPPALFTYVADRSALLVLDNLEQLAGADRVVSELLTAASAVVVVATSRRPLHVAGEHQHAVPPLELPADVGLEDAQRSGAVQLFVQQARAVKAGFALSADNAADVVGVCQRLDGLPLAIELAGARSKLLSPAALANRLDKALELKDTGVDRPNRQQTLHNAIGWSYNLLTPDLKAFFRQLGVFAGGGDLDAVSAVIPGRREPLDDIAELVDLSLATITDGADGEPRVGMLQIITAFARDRLTEHDELERSQQRHAEHYLAVAETLAPLVYGRDPGARNRLDAELDNVRAALTWTLPPDESVPDGHQVNIGLRLVAALWEFWLFSGYLVEARRWLERAVELGSDQDGQAMASALFGLGMVLNRLSRSNPGRVRDQSWDLLARSLTISRGIGDDSGVARALLGSAALHQDVGELDVARELYDQAIALYRRAGDDSGLGWSLSWLANLEQRFGSLDRARELSEESLEVAHRVGNDHLALIADMDIAWVLILVGQAHEALEHLHGLVDDVLARRDPWVNLSLVWAYSAEFAVLGDAERAAALQGTHEIGFRGDDTAGGMDIDPGDAALIERCYAKARPLISAEAWQRARHQGRTNTPERALTDARRVSEAFIKTRMEPLSAQEPD